jgi:hypothetical protein
MLDGNDLASRIALTARVANSSAPGGCANIAANGTGPITNI